MKLSAVTLGAGLALMGAPFFLTLGVTFVVFALGEFISPTKH